MQRAAVIPVEEFKTKAELCAFEIINFLIKHSLWQDTCIYVNGKRYSCYDGEHYRYDNTWDCVFREDNMDPKDYVEYTSDFLTMTFEGPFYDVVNYYVSAKYCDRLLKEFDDILNRYKKYYELGYAWSLGLYNI
jgi:hypothetical protein